MQLNRLFAGQLVRPSGMFASLILSRLWNSRNAALNDMTLDQLKLMPSDRVLEVGFGGGYLLGLMATIVTEGSLAGADASSALVASCASRFRSLVQSGRLDLRCASAQSLPFSSASFDKACSVNSLFYWPDAGAGIAELWRVLVPGGRVVLCFTDKASLEKAGLDRPGIARFDAAEVQRLMKLAGFGNITLTSGTDKHRTFWCATGIKQ